MKTQVVAVVLSSMSVILNAYWIHDEMKCNVELVLVQQDIWIELFASWCYQSSRFSLLMLIGKDFDCMAEARDCKVLSYFVKAQASSTSHHHLGFISRLATAHIRRFQFLSSNFFSEGQLLCKQILFNCQSPKIQNFTL